MIVLVIYVKMEALALMALMAIAAVALLILQGTCVKLMWMNVLCGEFYH